MYGWHPTVYKVWAYFIIANMYPLILMERFAEKFLGITFHKVGEIK